MAARLAIPALAVACAITAVAASTSPVAVGPTGYGGASGTADAADALAGLGRGAVARPQPGRGDLAFLPAAHPPPLAGAPHGATRDSRGPLRRRDRLRARGGDQFRKRTLPRSVPRRVLLADLFRQRVPHPRGSRGRKRAG